MTTVIYFIRHGESEANHFQDDLPEEDKRVWGRSTWSDLTEKGKQQARLLGEYFFREGIEFDRLVASSTVRTQQTARYCIEAMIPEDNRYEALGRLEVSVELAEHYMGDWEGHTRIETGFDRIREEMLEHPGMCLTFYSPNGETAVQVGARAKKYIEECLLDKENSSIALFVHRGVITWALYALFETSVEEFFHLDIPNTCFVRATYEDGQWKSYERVMIGEGC